MTDSHDRQPTPPTLKQALAYWLKLGFISFGGPAGQIAMMQSDLVDRRGWIDQQRFLNALNFCMLLPGPEAQQLATYVGLRMNGLAGGIAAGVLFVLPGAVVLLALSFIAAAYGDAPWVTAAFRGVAPVVIAIIAVALWRLARRTLKGPVPALLALAAFVGLQLPGVSFPMIVLGAALCGVLAGRFGIAGFGTSADPAAPAASEESGGWRRLLRLCAIFLGLWGAVVAGILATLGTAPFLGVIELFTTAAFVTFGGAYAVLPYIAERAVEDYGWLSSADMVRGLALAETTPGPLILVTQFVGFFAGWNQAGDLPQWLTGSIAAMLTVYVTFLPCFLFILAGAPYVERLSRNRRAAAALAAITAAVVGVILNLGVVLGEAILFTASGFDWVAAGVAAVSLVLLLRFSLQVHWAVLGGALFGLAEAALSGAFAP